MKLPNGYGSVYKLPGKRRKPFCARVTISVADGRQIRKIIGYYKTKKEALSALADYNNNPYDLSEKLLFKDIYKKWFKSRFDDNSNQNTVQSYESAFKRATLLHNKVFSDLKLKDLQLVVDQYQNSSASRLKILLKALYEWAVKYEYVNKNYAKDIDVKNPEHTKEKRAFAQEHISLLWNTLPHNDKIGIALMLIYSGVRIKELLDLKKENVNLKEQYFRVLGKPKYTYSTASTECCRLKMQILAILYLQIWRKMGLKFTTLPTLEP